MRAFALIGLRDNQPRGVVMLDEHDELHYSNDFARSFMGGKLIAAQAKDISPAEVFETYSDWSNGQTLRTSPVNSSN